MVQKGIPAWKNWGINSALVLNVLLLVWAVFQSQLQIPIWLQVVGRLHPVLLHFPIVFWLLLIAFILWGKRFKILNPAAYEMESFLLVVVANVSAITAVLGLLLSSEEAYNQNALAWHKWSGILLSLIGFFAMAFQDKWRNNHRFAIAIMVVGTTLVMLAGHQGAEITHGDNFVFAPFNKNKVAPKVDLQEAIVFNHMVQPVIENKCISCHNQQKAKGQLVLATQAEWLKGGKNGVLWTVGDSSDGLLLERIHLPMTDEKHMPPLGKPQLTAEEIMIVEEWMVAGANFTQKLIDLPQGNALRALGEKKFSKNQLETYAYKATNPDQIRKLSNANRLVQPLAEQESALSVTFFNKQNFNKNSLNELSVISEQIASLHLANMPVTDDEISIVRSFAGLQSINLNNTKITAKGLQNLLGLKYLQQISLNGLQLFTKDIEPLITLPALQKVFIWNTMVQSKDLAILQKKQPNIKWQLGSNADTIVLTLNPPTIANETPVITQATPLLIKHFIQGVEIRYTLDGTEPDSLLSPIYKAGVFINNSGTVKAKAFKKGWRGSETVEGTFYKRTFSPDSVVLLTKVNQEYQGDGGATLIDKEPAEKNFKNGKWLGYKDAAMVAFMYFNKPIGVSSVTYSGMVDIDRYIFPPLRVEIWGGNDRKKMKKLGVIYPDQPKKSAPSTLTGYTLTFNTTEVKYLQLTAVPVPKLPEWHGGKGTPAWIFADEVFVN